MREYQQYIQDGVVRMHELIEDLLAYSRVIHDEAPRGTQTNLNEALARATAVLQDTITQTGAIITAEHLPTVPGDETQLAQVLQNLLSNALKYRKPDTPPHVHITAVTSDGACTAHVRDNGVGFDQQHAVRIFVLFKRLHRNEYPGTGLGLAICKRIIERYSGTIWAESTLGVGSTFAFTLPCVSASATTM